MYKQYVIAALSYGAVRKLPQLWDAKERYFVKDLNNYEEKPMLMGNKLSAFAFGLAFSSVMTPFWLFDDLNKVDIYMKGHKQSDYGYLTSKSWYEHVFK
jgi:hypothetical protein